MSMILSHLLDCKPLRDKTYVFSHVGISPNALHIESAQ